MSRRALDNYPTPGRLTRALLEEVCIAGVVLEPCAGAGQIADVLRGGRAYGIRGVYINDLDPAHGCDRQEDATDPEAGIWKLRSDWVVTNPPFNQAMAILQNSYRCARRGVAFLLRLSFLEPTNGRAAWLREHEEELSDLLVFGSPRPSFTDDGRTDSATVAWMVWRRDWREGTTVRFVTGWAGAAVSDRTGAGPVRRGDG